MILYFDCTFKETDFSTIGVPHCTVLEQVREGISQEMSHSRVYLQHRRALQQRVQQHERAIQESLEPFFEADLWKFMEEAHVIAPKFFSKGVLWNKFIDAILEDSKQLTELGLSRSAVQLTRYWRGPEADNSQDAHLRNKLVFAEVVSAQSDERRPLYAELYEFFYKVPPETMYIKVLSIAAPQSFSKS